MLEVRDEESEKLAQYCFRHMYCCNPREPNLNCIRYLAQEAAPRYNLLNSALKERGTLPNADPAFLCQNSCNALLVDIMVAPKKHGATLFQ